jgi:hypothetical protein
MSAPVVTPIAFAEVACTLSMTGSEVRIDCETREEAEEVFDWLEAHIGRTAAEAASAATVAELVEALGDPAFIETVEAGLWMLTLEYGQGGDACNQMRAASDAIRAILARAKATEQVQA